ncbi:hypothetical protein BKA61DRAFT_298854 [Leptodontidium sp. MPI-SDFR-AT-0119]|nr:hypothetical protein BKA61DRAFT_298854 [Leptodontidium sp. MPI-SDFR-AT-0119]
MSHSIRRYKTDVSERSAASHSDESQDSQSTTPTSLYSSPSPSLRQATDLYSKQQYDISPCTTFCARSSTETYSSTVESLQELCEEPDSYDPEYEVPEYREPVDHNLRPSNPSDFADFFPTMNRLCIRHDDTTHDGNMNLRVDTERKRGTIQLFHLKMNDLKKREFSLRRYERSSGREVCHSARKFTTPSSEKRPAMARSVSNAFASIVKPEFKRTSSGLSTSSSHSAKKSIKRQDSGYGSNSDDDDEYYEDDNATYFPSPNKSKSTIQIPSNTTKLEFSNYAQVLVKRRGAKSSKRYEFEYWGHKYTWKRVVKKDGEGKEISYHLYQGDNGHAVAHIVPELRSRSQVREEERNGGWIKPCSMWISDRSVLEAVTDVADVIIATGLIALVDDSIKSHFHSTTRPTISRTHTLPIPKLGMDLEYVGPRALVEHMFKRRNSGASTKEREQRPSPLRAHAVTAY